MRRYCNSYRRKIPLVLYRDDKLDLTNSFFIARLTGSTSQSRIVLICPKITKGLEEQPIQHLYLQFIRGCQSVQEYLVSSYIGNSETNNRT